MALMNLSRFLLEEQKKFKEATGDFTIILEQIAFASKIISREVNKAGLVNILGSLDTQNIFGEVQQKLDIFANQKIIEVLDHLGKVCIMASEEEEDPIQIPDKYPKGKYVVVFDPLDGSSNIDVNVSIGTIFGIFRKKEEECLLEDNLLQSGKDLIAAGYSVYGSSTMFVYCAGTSVNGFTLDPSVGEFLLSHPDIKIPEKGNIYSVNEANYNKWDDKTREYIDTLKKQGYTSRYIGSLVSDFHRNLLKGGIFLYPADEKNKKGKLRMLYEAFPLAFIAKHAGGASTDGYKDILDIKPQILHDRTPLIIGSKKEVDLYKQMMAKD